MPEYYIGKKYQPKKYTRKELINELHRFEKENGRRPTASDFMGRYRNYPGLYGYPAYSTFRREFGNFTNALIDAGFEKNPQSDAAIKGRQGEIQNISEFKTEGVIDLSGNWSMSSCDGQCPKGELYDVKCASLIHFPSHQEADYWVFTITKNQLEDAKYIFLRAYKDKDFNKPPQYKWRVPIEFFESKTTLSIYKNEYGSRQYHKHNVENMKEYEIKEESENKSKDEVC